MRKKSLKLKIFFLTIIFCGVFGVAGKSFGADFYITQNSSGSNTGVDCANAHSVSWFNASGNWANPKVENKIGPGDTAHLCGTISSSLKIQDGGIAGYPIKILFEIDAKMSAPVWEFVSWRRAALYSGGADNIIIDGGTNGVIEATDNGTEYSNKEDITGVWIYSGDNVEVKNLTIRDLYRRTPLSGDSGDGGSGISTDNNNNLKLHHNTLSESNTGISISYRQSNVNHNIYDNYISRVSNGITVGSANTDCTLDSVNIYNNEITDGFVWDGVFDGCTGDCWFHNDGIQLWAVHEGSRLNNVRIYGNHIYGDMGRHITGWIFWEGNASNLFVYNNVLTSSGTSYPANGFITGTGMIFNNTIAALSGGGNGINSRGDSQIYNNLFWNIGNAIAIHDPGANTRCDYNSFHFSDGFSIATVGSGGAFLFSDSMEEWRQKTGLDTHSLVADPLLINIAISNFRLSINSPAKNAGTDLAGYFNFDKDNILRPQGVAWDMGAYEYISGGGDTTAPGFPSGLAVN